MKKIKAFFFLVTLVILTVSTISTTGQTSRVYAGDKNLEDVRSSRKIYKAQLRLLNRRLQNLQEDNAKLANIFRRESNPSMAQSYSKMIKRNDSLIAVAQNNVQIMQNKSDGFVDVAAGKDQQYYADLKSSNPMVLANATLLLAYAEKVRDGGTPINASQQATEKVDGADLKGIVENRWYYETIVTITGPGNFYREFTLRKGQKSPVFSLPIPGNYTTTFNSRGNYKSITKPVAPNIVYYDEQGNSYDYKATLPSN